MFIINKLTLFNNNNSNYNNIIIHSKYFPDSDWLKALA